MTSSKMDSRPVGNGNVNVKVIDIVKKEKVVKNTGFQVPLHFPFYKKADYEKMEEWRVDFLLEQYGIPYKGTLDEKRDFAIGAFLWPHQS
ncbi:hypothetical protein GIB67_013414 [Kingdonia uniflora]|uniref:DUF7722 domain-containing protein n=1 Tax=Kingdonia uniflora TaxID=39325 RepID=A0A7J7LQY6_9MAGN|nr:hypothetical protein GIB67_013414 [Kingdonia uniflora]